MVSYEREYYVESNGESYCAKPVPPDGNCFYYSVSYLLYEGDIRYSIDFRKRCADYVSRNSEIFNSCIPENESIHDFIQRISRPNVWADDVEIRAVSLTYDLEIRIYSFNEVPGRITFLNSHGNGRIINLMFHHDGNFKGGHFWPLIKIENQRINGDEMLCNMNVGKRKEPFTEVLDEECIEDKEIKVAKRSRPNNETREKR